MRKRIMSALLSLVLIAPLVPTAAHAMSFPDVDSNASYAAAVENISELGIMVGSSNGKFNPDQIVSRCEMAAIICRMLGATENLSKSEVFGDVSAGHWANPYIAKASEFGIVKGYGHGQFGPGDPVTYEQAVAMVVRAIGEDSNAIRYGGYPNGYLQAAEESSLLAGLPAVQGQGMSRGAVAMLLNNYYMWRVGKPGDGHTCQYVERTLPGSGVGGHYEQMQTSTKTVVEYEWVTVYECDHCKATTTDYEENSRHLAPGGPCMGYGYMIRQKQRPVAIKEEPVYENKWVNDSTITLRVCALCGQMEQS